MKNYLERFVGNPHSFQRKIITIYLVLTIIPMLLIALIITGVYYQRILDSAYNILNENAQQHEIIVQERMENFENEKTQTSDSRGGSFCPVSGSADIFPVFRRRNGAQPRREGRIFLQPDPF